MNNTDFAVFILTNGRPDHVVTYSTLRRQGYTGLIYLLVDDEDNSIKRYKELYKNVIVFNKQKAIDYTDSGDNFQKRNSVVYARNWNFIVAKQLGLKYFLQLDDDYVAFYNAFDNDRKYLTKRSRINSLDKVFSVMFDFLVDSGADAIATSQGGDFIGGPGSKMAKLQRQGKFSRKIMNAFFFSTNKPIKFMGRINEDVNAYVNLGSQGYLFITVPRIRLEQITTQTNSGGLTDIYKDLGTYVKSFYSVMYAPSSVFVTEMGVTFRRLHHQIKWKHAIPLIVDASQKK